MTRVSLALTKLAVQFGIDFPAIRLAAYIDALRGCDQATVLAGIERCGRSCKFFPTVAEILAATGATPEAEAAEAWTEALRIAGLGRDADRSGQASLAIREAVRLVGGWEAIGKTPTDRLHFVERRFIAAYTTSSARIDSIAIACEAGGNLELSEG
jgi:hypothetical protein